MIRGDIAERRYVVIACIFILCFSALSIFGIINRNAVSADEMYDENINFQVYEDAISDIEEEYQRIKDNHKIKVSITADELSRKASLINENIGLINKYKNTVDIGAIYSGIEGEISDGSAKANILTGYIDILRSTDELFQVSTQDEADIMVNRGGSVVCYKYNVSEEPPVNYNNSYLENAREVKERVENFILLYSVTGDAKYLEALKLEVVSAANWANRWQSSAIIAVSEIAYAVSLGYDFAYDEFTREDRCAIENQLLVAVLLHSIGRYTENLYDGGNYNQVGNSGIGVATLALIDSSNEGKIRVVKVDSNKKDITIRYPVKRIENGELAIDYADILLRTNESDFEAVLVNDDMFDLLASKIQTDGDGQYVPLRTLYAATITRTVRNLKKVLRSNVSYIDGSYPEGKMYYLYGMRYFSYYLATLNNTLNNDYGILNFENSEQNSIAMFNNIVLNPIYVANASGQNIAYGDAPNDTTDSEDTILYLANVNARKTNRQAISNAVYDYKKRTRNAWHFYGIMWYDERNDALKNEIDYEKIFDDAIYRNSFVKENVSRMGVSAFRDGFTESNNLFVAMRGGSTEAHHTHLDLGSFTFDALGTRWIMDPGAGPYSAKKYHDKEYLRWQYYAARAEAHSTIVINKPTTFDTASKGTVLSSDQWVNAYGEFKKFDSSENSNISVIDLTDAYNKVDNDEIVNVQTNSNKVNRGIKLIDFKKYVFLQDEVTLENVTDYYSFLNINKEKDSASGRYLVNVDILDGEKEALLTDLRGNKVKLYLVSDNENVKFAKIDSLTNGTGLLNDFIGNKNNNTYVSLGDNARFINHNKIAVYLHNDQAKNISMKVGVLFAPVYDNEDINPELLSLINLSEWYVPEKPAITVLNKNSGIVSNNSVVDDKAVIKINTIKTKKNNEIIKYSLDSGATWNIYNDNDSDDLDRRTFSDAGEYDINVMSILDDGSGVQSDTAISRVSFSIANNGGAPANDIDDDNATDPEASNTPEVPANNIDDDNATDPEALNTPEAPVSSNNPHTYDVVISATSVLVSSIIAGIGLIAVLKRRR